MWRDAIKYAVDVEFIIGKGEGYDCLMNVACQFGAGCWCGLHDWVTPSLKWQRQKAIVRAWVSKNP